MAEALPEGGDGLSVGGSAVLPPSKKEKYRPSTGMLESEVTSGEHGTPPARPPGATTAPLRVLPPRRALPRSHPRRTVTYTGVTTGGGGETTPGTQELPRARTAAGGCCALRAISGAEGPPGQGRGAAGSPPPARCRHRCPGSARAHSSAQARATSALLVLPALASGPGHRSYPGSHPPQPDHRLAAARTAGGRYNDSRLVIKITAVSLAQRPPTPASSCQLPLASAGAAPSHPSGAGGGSARCPRARLRHSRGAGAGRGVLPGPSAVPEKERAAPGSDADAFLNGSRGGSWMPRALFSLAGANGRS